MNEQMHQIEMIKAQAKVELNKLEASSPAKDDHITTSKG